MPILNFQNIAPVGSGSVNATFGNKAAPAKSAKKGDRMGYKRLAKNRNGSVKEMKAAIKEHNKRYCISTTGNKATLKQKMKRVDKKLSTIAKTGKRTGGGGGGSTGGQKTAVKKLNKLASAYGALENDANPEYAFDTGQSAPKKK